MESTKNSLKQAVKNWNDRNSINKIILYSILKIDGLRIKYY